MATLNTTFNEKANALFINDMFTCETIARMHATMVRLYEAVRTLRGLSETPTPTDIAKALNQSQQTINNWERRGMSRPGMIEAQKLIGCSATWLQTGKGSMVYDASLEPATDVDNGLSERIRTILTDPEVKPYALAKAAGVTQDTLAQWESGAVKTIRLDQAVGIQDAFGYNAVWLVMGKGHPRAAVFDDPRPKALPPKAAKPKKKAEDEPSDPTPLTYLANTAKYRPIPVVGRAQGGLPDRIWTDGDYPVGATQQFAEVASADPQAFLTPVVGLSMIPRYNPGEFALVEPGTEPELEDDVLVRLNTGETMIKRLLSRRQGIRLGSYNESEVFTFDPQEITWMYYIAHPVPARKIKNRL